MSALSFQIRITLKKKKFEKCCTVFEKYCFQKHICRTKIKLFGFFFLVVLSLKFHVSIHITCPVSFSLQPFSFLLISLYFSCFISEGNRQYIYMSYASMYLLPLHKKMTWLRSVLFCVNQWLTAPCKFLVSGFWIK